jgi:hypothetical protein
MALAAASVTTFVGMAMIVVSETVGALGLAMEGSAMILFLLGLLAAFVGMMALGVVTVGARVLPFWCGAALMVGGFGFMVELAGDWIIGASGTGYFNALVLVTGIPWVVVATQSSGREHVRPSSLCGYGNERSERQETPEPCV